MRKTDDTLQKKVLALAQNGKISCAQALALAGAAGVPAAEVGRAADAAGVKIANCQLGCFGKERQ